jgi:TM2 domain-containing membrane protein YozV
MSANKTNEPSYRFVNAYITPHTINYLHFRNPWITAWWSAAFPGFGHLMLCKYVEAFILMGWELTINSLAGINRAIYYSMTGQFESAKYALDTTWFLFYIGPFIFCIWDSYNKTIELNKAYLNGYWRDNLTLSVNISALGLNNLVKRIPYLAAVWSFIAPGLGHFYINRMPTVIFIGFFSLLVFHLSHLLPAIHWTMKGNFSKAESILDPQWLLNIPSLYVFAAYDAYVNAVEYNRLFEKEQGRYLKNDFQDDAFQLVEGLKCIP